jgi:aspartokinase-like uncharacterized kinase
MTTNLIDLLHLEDVVGPSYHPYIWRHGTPGKMIFLRDVNVTDAQNTWNSILPEDMPRVAASFDMEAFLHYVPDPDKLLAEYLVCQACLTTLVGHQQ